MPPAVLLGRAIDNDSAAAIDSVSEVGRDRAWKEWFAMALPQQAEARLYYRAAKQRFEDAKLLLNAQRTTGAVYLAGYTVECYLKALILSGVASRLREQLLETFRGRLGHDVTWLARLYRDHVRKVIPREVSRHLTRLTEWSTDLRYETGALKKRDAKEFLESVFAIANWAEGSM